MKAMEKDRNRRYETANAFGNDVLRYLADEPVTACPPSRSYRFSKYVRKHRGLFSAVASLALILLAGLISTSVALFFEERARRDAEISKEAADIARTDAVLRQQEAIAAQEGEAKQRAYAEQKAIETEWHLYVARQFPIIDAWKKESFGLLDRLLDDLTPAEGQPDFRGWEHSYFRDQCDRRFTTLARDSAAIACSLTLSEVAFALPTGEVEVWSCKDRRLMRQFKIAYGTGISAMSLSPSGEFIACGKWGGCVFLYSAITGQLSRELPRFNSDVCSLTWSPDSKYIAIGNRNFTGREQDIRVFDIATGQLTQSLVKPGESSPVGDDKPCAAAWSPDGSHLATGHGGGLTCIWDTASWTVVSCTTSCASLIEELAWSPRGDQYATLGTDDSHHFQVCIWDLSGKAVSEFDVSASNPRSLHWFADAEIAVGGLDSLVTVWDVSSGKQTHSLSLHNTCVADLFMSAGGDCCVSRDSDGVVRVSNPAEVVVPSLVLSLDDGSQVSSIAWQPDGKRLYAGSTSSRITAWDAVEGKREFSRESHCADYLSWSHETGLLSTCGHGSAVRWDSQLVTPQQVAKCNFSWISSIQVSPDGKWLAVCSWFEDAAIVDLRRGTIVTRVPDSGGAICGWTRDSSTACIWRIFDPKAYAWHASTKEAVEIPSPCSLDFGFGRKCLKVDPTGQVMAIGLGNGRLLFVDSVSGTLITGIMAHAGDITCMDWSPDGTRLATNSADGRVKIWDGVTMTELLSFSAEDNRPFGAKWSSDGRSLAAYTASQICVYRTVKGSNTRNARPRMLETGRLAIIIPPSQLAEPSREVSPDRGPDNDSKIGAEDWLQLAERMAFCGNWRRAKEWYMTAAEHAKDSDALLSERLGRGLRIVGRELGSRHLATQLDVAEVLGQSIAYLQRAIVETPAGSDLFGLKTDWADAHAYLSGAEEALGEFDQAIASRRKAIAMWEELEKAEPQKNEWYRHERAHFSVTLAELLSLLGRPQEALECSELALRLHTELVAEFPENKEYSERLAWSRQVQEKVLANVGQNVKNGAH